MIDDNNLKAVVAVGLLLLMGIGLTLVVYHRIRRELGFGYRFIQVLTIVQVVPSILLLAILGVLKSDAVSALIGGVLGYAFSLKAKEESGGK